MKHNYHERKENRIQFALDQAAKHKQLSNDFYVRSSEMASFIPFGQPILIGHHSEKSDRNYRNRIHNLMGKSVKAQDTADYYEDKAASIQNNTAIFSDNPDALQLLIEKRDRLLKNQEFMKAANKCIRKGDKAGFLSLEGGTAALWDEINAAGRFGGKGYARFELSNNNQTISTVKKRIAFLESQAARPAVDKLIQGIRLVENREANRLQIYFGCKPSDEVRAKLRHLSFIYCYSESAWQTRINNWNYHRAKEFLESLSPDVAAELKTPANRL